MDDELYRTFAAIEDAHWWFVARRKILRRLVERWIPARATVIDVGCGTGGLLADLQGEYNVRGIDPSPLALDACRRRGLASALEGNATDSSTWGPLPVGAVLLLDVIEHLEDDTSALAAAHDAIASDGRVIVTVPAYQWLWSQHDVINHHFRRYTRRRLVESHLRARLRPVHSGYFNTALFPIAALQRATQRIGLNSDPLRLPPRMINSLLTRIFQAEATALSRLRRGFPLGLSVFCVSERMPDRIDA